MLVDIHIHFDDSQYDADREAVMQRAKEAGVTTIITAGLGPKTNRKALALTQQYDCVRATLGIYPIDALDEQHAATDITAELAYIEEHKQNIFGIGECGLDLFHGKDIDKQIPVFAQQIALARKLKKPIVVHSRKAELETIETLEKHKAERVVLHCFGGRKHFIEKAVALGYYFSIPPSILRATHFQQLVEVVPLRQLLTETDGPYQSPFKKDDVPVRNEPAFILETIRCIARIKGLTEQECRNQLYMNFQRLQQ